MYTQPEYTPGIVRNLLKTTVYLRIPRTFPEPTDRAFQRSNNTVPLPPSVDVKIFWEDFIKVETELAQLQSKGVILIVQYPVHTGTATVNLTVQRDGAVVTFPANTVNFTGTGIQNVVDDGGGKATIVVGSKSIVFLDVPVDPAEAATIGNKIVRFDGTVFKKAIASDPINALAMGIAKNVNVVTNKADIYLFGIVPGINGLTNETPYYLSQTSPGDMISVRPTSGIVLPVGQTFNSTALEYYLDIDQISTADVGYLRSFVVGDWVSTDAGDTWSILINHNLGMLFPQIEVFDSGSMDIVMLHRTRAIDVNNLRISVSQASVDCRFNGVINAHR